MRLFALNLTVSDAVRLAGLSVRAVNEVYPRLRYQLMAYSVPAELGGTVELDENYFGPRRVRGKWGWGASGKIIVFGLFKCSGQVYTEIVPDCSKKTYRGMIRGKIAVTDPASTNGPIRPALPTEFCLYPLTTTPAPG